ncbi:MAG: hypothetical protein R2932_58005 [Caldilineaceae bacterium]
MTSNVFPQIGPFQIHEEFQRTSLTTLYRATDTRTEQTVILHRLNPTLAQYDDIVQQFLAASQQAQALHHRAIVPVLESGIDEVSTAFDDREPVVYAVGGELLPQTLSNFLRQQTEELDLRTAFHILKTVAAALDAAHTQGVIHGRISPDTIYVGDLQPDGQLPLVVDGFYAVQIPQTEVLNTDVAAETSAPTDPAHTQYLLPPPKALAGSDVSDLELASAAAAEDQDDKAQTMIRLWPLSPYMAPEQARIDSEIGPRADVYGLGALAYVLLLGRPPFRAKDEAELRSLIANRLPTTPESIKPTISPGIAYVLKSVLAKDPSTRYSSATEFVTALEQGSQWSGSLANVLPASAAQQRLVRSAQGTARRERRLRGAWIIAAFLALIVVALGVTLSNATVRSTVLAELATRGINVSGLVVQRGSEGDGTEESSLLTPVVMLMASPPATTPTPTGVIRILGGPTPPAQAVAAATIVTLTTATPDGASATMTTSVSAAASALLSASATLEAPSRATRIATLSAGNSVGDDLALLIDPLNLLAGEIVTGQIVISGQAAPGLRLAVLVDGRTVGNTVVKSTGTWSVIAALETPGPHDIVATLFDKNGDIVSTDARTITVSAQTPVARTALNQRTGEITATVTVTAVEVARLATSNSVTATTPAATSPAVVTNAPSASRTSTATFTAVPTVYAFPLRRARR